MIYLTNLGNQTRRCCLLNTYHICFFFFILDSILKLEIGYDYKAKRAECVLEALAVDGWKKKGSVILISGYNAWNIALIVGLFQFLGNLSYIRDLLLAIGLCPSWYIVLCTTYVVRRKSCFKNFTFLNFFLENYTVQGPISSFCIWSISRARRI